LVTFAGNPGFVSLPLLDPHEATLTFVDDDHYEIAGVAWVDGKPAEMHCGTMKLVRKK